MEAFAWQTAMTPSALFAVFSALALFALFYRQFGWRRTLLYTLPSWLLLNIAVTALLARVGLT